MWWLLLILRIIHRFIDWVPYIVVLVVMDFIFWVMGINPYWRMISLWVMVVECCFHSTGYPCSLDWIFDWWQDHILCSYTSLVYLSHTWCAYCRFYWAFLSHFGNLCVSCSIELVFTLFGDTTALWRSLTICHVRFMFVQIRNSGTEFF